MNIYVVTDGEYSDYHIIGIYSTEELANDSIKLHAGGRIEVWELDKIPPHPQGLYPFCVEMTEDGAATKVERESVEFFDRSHFDKWRPYGDGKTVCFYMWAEDETHAIKIANEMRTQLIANHQWNADWASWMLERRSQ